MSPAKATTRILWTKQVKRVKFNRNIKENEKRQWHFNHNVQPSKKEKKKTLLIVAFQTSVPHFSAKPAIHCTKQHNSAILHEGQMWRETHTHKKNRTWFIFPFCCRFFSLRYFEGLHFYILNVLNYVCLFMSKLQWKCKNIFLHGVWVGSFQPKQTVFLQTFDHSWLK